MNKIVLLALAAFTAAVWVYVGMTPRYAHPCDAPDDSRLVSMSRMDGRTSVFYERPDGHGYVYRVCEGSRVVHSEQIGSETLGIAVR